MDTEAQIITSTAVLEEAARGLRHTGDPQQLAERLTVTVPPNTEILDFRYRGATAVEARRGAEAFAEAYLANREAGAQAAVQGERETLETRLADLSERLQSITEAIASMPEGSAARAYNESQASTLNNQISNLGTQLDKLDALRLTPGRVITQASLPQAPTSPDPLLNLAAGGLLGLVAGVGLAVLRQRSDRYIRRSSDVDRGVAVPVLADMPVSMDPEQVRLAGPSTPEGRSYTRLRNVVTASVNNNARVVLVAGVSGPAGPVAANLAASLARTGEETVLVCGDVQAPTEAKLLGDHSTKGLAEVLAGQAAPRDALRRLATLPDLRVLGPGGDRDLAAELLQTAGPRTLITDLLDTAAWVVLEAPATNTGADAQTLARYADLAVLVVQTNGTTAQEVIDARSQFESMRTPVLGAVVVPPQPRERSRERGKTTTGGDMERAVSRSPVSAVAGSDG
jgi:capsular polysaccharide biosynthesis protein